VGGQTADRVGERKITATQVSMVRVRNTGEKVTTLSIIDTEGHRGDVPMKGKGWRWGKD